MPDRVRRIDGGFAFVPNRFLHDGFFAQLTHLERLDGTRFQVLALPPRPSRRVWIRAVWIRNGAAPVRG